MERLIDEYRRRWLEAFDKEFGVDSQRWIPVSERLPEVGVSVLCSSPEPPGDDWVWIGQREEHEWYFPGANEMGTPTHWMTLPEPPITDEVRALHDVAREIAKAKGPKQTLGDFLMRPPEPPEVK